MCDVSASEFSQDRQRANGSAKKGEPDSPEQKEYEYEYEKEQTPIPFKGKKPQATPYEQQRREQQDRKALRGKSFPTPLSGETLRAKKQEAQCKLAEFARRYSGGNSTGTAD